MASFDVSSEVDWQEIDNASTQAKKELENRFDFKGVKVEIETDKKAKTVVLRSTKDNKLSALRDTFQTKLVKRGVSLLSFDFQEEEPASAGSARQIAVVHSGISKDKAKEVIKSIKEGKFKVQTQIQDEQVRVTAKKRDDLQEVITYLREKQNSLQIPLQFGNFRD